jgi:hypothetical protein
MEEGARIDNATLVRVAAVYPGPLEVSEVFYSYDLAGAAEAAEAAGAEGPLRNSRPRTKRALAFPMKVLLSRQARLRAAKRGPK